MDLWNMLFAFLVTNSCAARQQADEDGPDSYGNIGAKMRSIFSLVLCVSLAAAAFIEVIQAQVDILQISTCCFAVPAVALLVSRRSTYALE